MGILSRGDRSASSRQADAINTGAEGLSKGSRVWVKGLGHAAWEMGELRSIDGAAAQVLLDRTNKLVNLKMADVVPANPKLQEGIPDLTHLSYLNEPGILHNLNFRYATDAIYTFAGPVLIALNPCKPLNLYTQEVANAYKAGARDVVQSANMEPHIYLVAANAFRRMLREKMSQSLIVNGESGAGKTETTKKAMQYFATLAGGTGVEDQVLETNPILEAFGNAKTLRNHNSSRFGKLIQIHFNQGHHICGAAIKTYLLEKSRVVHQLKGERSYHIFYQLVRGSSPDMKKALCLPDKVTGFNYLASSGCTEIDGVDDAKEFREVCHALGDIGIDQQQQHSLFRLLSGVMWLGNLKFKVDPNDRANDAAMLVVDAACNAACAMLGVAPEALNAALTRKKIVTPGEVVIKVLNLQEARDCTDALAKALYAAAFDWIVACINIKLDSGKSRQGGLSIAILDIYGFEQFQTNSFEQLCINYANERLQQQFTRHLFTLEQQEYESEGIDWTKVEFIDNWECVDAIEAAPPRGLGVLAVLDAQCKFPKATDDSFVQKLKEALTTHSHFDTNPRRPSEFTILHYAGAVSYSAQNFLDKNKDTLNFDLVELMLASDPEQNPLVSQLGTNVKTELEANAKRGQTVGSRFSMQLRDLIAELDATGLHFVRCIKPNAKLLPNQWEEALVLHQLRCCGVLEVARIARAGYPTRYTHQAFAERYAILLPRDQQAALLATATMRRSGGGDALATDSGALQACKQLLTIFGLHADQYQIGHTKIFFRPGALGFVEDKWASMQSSALKIQSYFRMYRARAAYCSLRNGAIMFQAVYRSRFERRMYEDLKQKHRAACLMQRIWRARFARRNFKQQQRAAMTIQKAWFRYKLTKRVNVRVMKRRQQELLKRMEQDKFDSIRNQYGCEMDDVRAALEAWQTAKQSGEATDLTQVMAATQAQRGITTAAAAGAGVAAGAAAVTRADGGEQPGEAAVGGVCKVCQKKMDEEGRPLAADGEPGTPLAVEERAAEAPAVPTSSSTRFTAAQEAKEAAERQALENVRLSKQLALERSLKDRYQHKYEEQNALWMEQIKVLQEYIQHVRQAFGDARLPPLPSALANAAGIHKTSSTAMLPLPDNGAAEGANGLATSTTDDRTSPFALQGSTEANGSVNRRGKAGPLGATAYVMHAEDEDEEQQANNNGGYVNRTFGDPEESEGFKPARRPPGLSVEMPSDDPYADQAGYAMPPDTMRTDMTSPGRPVVGRGGGLVRSQAVQGRAPAPAGPAAGGVAGKYVSQLDGELARVQQVLDDDVDFIAEVAGGAAFAPHMDPGSELSRLRKKFDLWKKEFRDKLVTAEEVLKKLDRMQGVPQMVNGRGGAGYATNGYYSPATPGNMPTAKSGFMGKLFKGK